MQQEDSSAAMKGTASVLELENRRLFEPQKPRKRVSFKDEAWVIQIPAACEESDVDLPRSVILTRNAVANGTITPSKRTSLETFRASSYTNKDQRSPQAHSCRIVSSGHATNRGPYKSILKTSTPSHQRDYHLRKSQMPTRHFRDLSTRHSVDGYLKHDSSHLLPSKDSVNRLEKEAFARPLSTRRSLTMPRALGSNDDFSYNKTGRFVGKDYSASSRPAVELNYNQYHHERDIKTKNTATQPVGVNFNIVGVTYRSVNEVPYFYDIRGLTDRVSEYSSGSKSPLNGQARFIEHSSVPKPLNQFGPSKREERQFSAIPAIEAFNRRNRVTRRHLSSAWTSEQVTSPKRQLPIAWQPAKQYNFSTK